MSQQAEIAAGFGRLAQALKTLQASAAVRVPTQAAADFVVPANTQTLFAEPISMPAGAWIEVRSGGVLREVA